MADFFNELPANTYKSILNVGPENNQIIDETLRPIEDGRGNATAFQLSRNEVKIERLLVDGIIIDDGKITGAIMESITTDGGTF
jgi:hypothetical protein